MFFFCSVDSFHSSLSKSFPPFISWPNSRAFESKNTPASSDVTPADITPLQSPWSAGFIIENLPFLCIDCSPLIVFLKVPEGRVVQGAVRSVSSCPGVSVGSSFWSDFSCWWWTHRFLLSLKKQSAVKCLRRWWIFREYCWMQDLITAPLTQYRYTEGKKPKNQCLELQKSWFLLFCSTFKHLKPLAVSSLHLSAVKRCVRYFPEKLNNDFPSMEMLQLSAFTLDGLFLEPDKSTYLLIHVVVLS